MLNREAGVSFPLRKALAPLAVLAVALLSAGCTHLPPAQADACRLRDVPKADVLMDIPFEVLDGRIYVEARVNGRGPFRFAVDTGASGMARADTRLVAALGLTVQGQATSSDGVQTAKVDMTHLQSLELAGLARQNLDVITRDYSGRKSPAAAFSGIIGREFFADGLLTIDYPNKRLRFSRMHALSAHEQNVLTYARAFRVPVSIGNLQTEGNLDTGANVSFVLPRSLYDKVAAGPLAPAGRGQLTNGDIETMRATVPGPFRIGGGQLADVEVRVSDRFPELLVGAHALQHFVVMIDQRSKRIAICP